MLGNEGLNISMKRIKCYVPISCIICIGLIAINVSCAKNINGDNELLMDIPVAFNEKSDDKISIMNYHDDIAHVGVEEGPESFYVNGDEFYIVDSVNERVTIISNNEIIQIIETPFNKFGRIVDIVVDASNVLWVLNDTFKVFVFDSTKENIIKEINLRSDDKSIMVKDGEVDYTVYYCSPERLYNNNGKIIVSLSNGKKYYVSDNGVLRLEIQPEVSKFGRSAEVKLTSNNVLDILPLNKNADIYISSNIDKDNKGLIYINSLETGEFTKGYQSKKRIIRKYNERTLVGIADIVRNDHFRPIKSFYVSQEGDLYQMELSKERLRIYMTLFVNLHDYNNNYSGYNSVNIKMNETQSITHASSTWSDVSENELFEKMNYYLNGMDWTFNRNKNADPSVTKNPSALVQPSILASLSDGQNHFLNVAPYCWCGFDGLTTRSWSWEDNDEGNMINEIHFNNFYDAIDKRAYAGNVSSANVSYMKGTCGLDCSGYVSVVFNLNYKRGTMKENTNDPKYFLSAYPGDADCEDYPFVRVNNDSVRKFDILNKLTHVLIVSEVTDYNIVVYEATSLGNGTVRRHTYNRNSLFDDYDVYRYKGNITSSTPCHEYDNECDTDCNICGELRIPPHLWSSDCDEYCNLCSLYRTPLAEHNCVRDYYSMVHPHYAWYKCTHCSYRTLSSEQQSWTTEWDYWYTLTYPTCTKSGSEARELLCSLCSKVLDEETRIIPALGHNMKFDYYSSSHPHRAWYKCIRCSYRTLSSEQQYWTTIWDSWYTLSYPTCTQSGSESRELLCSLCNEVLDEETRIISALGHSWGDWYMYDIYYDGGWVELWRRDCRRCDAYEWDEIRF